jgi:hypothetical protein
MADFVAVIRKAVDGLANNTPETRTKVYEKARSAVVRQLENMKPRPPEELLNRQIAKLDAAIAEVEGDYAEALPALEDDEDDFLVEQEQAPLYAASDEPAAYDTPEPAQEPEPVAVEASVYQPPYEEPTHVEPEVAEEPAAYQEPAFVEPAATQDPPYEAEPEDTTTYHEATYHEPLAPQQDDSRYDEEATAPVQASEDVVEAEAEPVQDHAHANWVGSDTIEEPEWQSSYVEPDNQYGNQWTQNTAPQEDEPDLSEPHNSEFEGGYTSSQQYDQDVKVEISEPRFDRLPNDRQPIDDAADDIFGRDDQYETQTTQRDEDRSFDPITGAAVVAGSAALAASSSSAARVDSDNFNRYFDDAIDQTPAATQPGAALPRADADPFTGQTEGGKRDAWDDLEDLIGYDGRTGQPSTSASATDGIDGTLRGDNASVIPQNVYVTKKKNRTRELLLGAVGVLVLAGGAYALYENRSALNDMVGGLTESAQTPPSATTPASTDAAPSDTATSTGIPLPSSNGGTDNGETTGTKFTQRLLADGTENDEGPAPVSSAQPSTAEGVSQAAQNEAAPAAQPPVATEAPAQTAPVATEQAPAVAQSGERMFLYEEVLGQSVPSAIPGTVAWSVVNEQDAEGKALPTIQGQLTVPDRGISALLTFKKNTDASLPASHIIEIVFSTGAGFEGGAIDSVQRVAMKTTEQDRGNALIAVPAKITDDFHMVALNDFPDALATNMELLRTRDWIDIPLAYRNGRRALMTLQKGPAGKQAFDTAIREWQAAAPAGQ